MPLYCQYMAAIGYVWRLLYASQNAIFVACPNHSLLLHSANGTWPNAAAVVGCCVLSGDQIRVTPQQCANCNAQRTSLITYIIDCWHSLCPIIARTHTHKQICRLLSFSACPTIALSLSLIPHAHALLTISSAWLGKYILLLHQRRRFQPVSHSHCEYCHHER